jgi:hypothetical protein
MLIFLFPITVEPGVLKAKALTLEQFPGIKDCVPEAVFSFAANRASILHWLGSAFWFLGRRRGWGCIPPGLVDLAWLGWVSPFPPDGWSLPEVWMKPDLVMKIGSAPSSKKELGSFSVPLQIVWELGITSVQSGPIEDANCELQYIEVG